MAPCRALVLSAAGERIVVFSRAGKPPEIPLDRGDRMVLRDINGF